MLIKLADDNAERERLKLLQDFPRLRMPESATLFLRERGYAPAVTDHYPAASYPNQFHIGQSKSAIL